MEGIDRLHQIAEDVGRTVWLRDLGAALSDTADAIEGGMRDLSGYESDVLAWVEKNGGLDAVNERTMPDDMEWPRYADCSPVEIGDDVIGPDYGERIHVDEIIFHANGFTLRSKGGDGKWYESYDRFEHPAVPASDGKPLEVGQTVYHTDTGREYQIHSINDDGKGAFVYNNSLGQDAAGLHLCPVGNLTHQRPVLDADGVPINVGDTVWFTTSGCEMRIDKIEHRPEGFWALELFADGSERNSAPVSVLTHTKPEPDSWSSVWTDVSNGNETPEGMMRRCRALAERGE